MALIQEVHSVTLKEDYCQYREKNLPYGFSAWSDSQDYTTYITYNTMLSRENAMISTFWCVRPR